MEPYYKYVEEYLQYSLISIAGKSKFSLEKYTENRILLMKVLIYQLLKLNCIVNIPQHIYNMAPYCFFSNIYNLPTIN
jgi:hypothetical protein